MGQPRELCPFTALNTMKMENPSSDWNPGGFFDKLMGNKGVGIQKSFIPA